MSNLLNLGKVLTGTEQKSINGGKEAPIQCMDDDFVCQTGICVYGHCY